MYRMTYPGITRFSYYSISDETNEDIALYSARVLGLAPEVVYKTIIMENSEREHFVFCLPAGFSISLKKARDLTSSSSIDLMKTDKFSTLCSETFCIMLND